MQSYTRLIVGWVLIIGGLCALAVSMMASVQTETTKLIGGYGAIAAIAGAILILELQLPPNEDG